jgi:O-antigen/teichoic acid export membrane protein
MNQSKNLFKNTLIYAIGNFGSRILAFILLPLYSYYLNAKDFGVYDLVIATITLLVPFITLQISDAVYRWLLEAKENDPKRSITISSGFFLLVLLSIVFCLVYYIVSIFIKYEYGNYFALVVLFSCYLPFFQQTVRGLGNNKLYAMSGIINTLFTLILNICFLVFLKFGLISLFIASIISNIITIIFIGISIKVYHLISWRHVQKCEIKNMLSYSWPLIPNTISWWLINVADKYIILYILGIEANGIYAVSARFPAIISLLNSIFIMAWQDHGITTNNSPEAKAFFSRIFDRFITFELTFVIFLISLSPYLVRYFINFKFYDSYKYMPLLYIGVAYSSFAAYMGVGYQKAKQTKNILKTSIIGGLINISISLFLLSYIGLYAPALGTFVSFLVIYLIRKFQTNKFFYIEVNNKKLAILTCIALIYPVQYFLLNKVYSLIFVLIALIIFVFYNKEAIFKVFNTIKNPLKNILKLNVG